MRVRAMEKGFDGVSLREPGEEFDLPDQVYELDPRTGKRVRGADGKDKMVPFKWRGDEWFERVEDADEDKPKSKRG